MLIKMENKMKLQVRKVAKRIQKSKKKAKAFFAKFKDSKFAVCYCCYDDSESVEELTSVEDIISCLQQENINWRSIRTDEELLRQLKDCHRDTIQVLSLEVHRKSRENKRRQKLEEQASIIASRYGCEVNSLEFLDACDRELEKFASDRIEIYEDILAYAGNSEAYYQDRDESYGDAEKIAKIQDWIKGNMPLLWGNWQYQKQNNII
jgi:hypothetical protein